MAGLDTAKFVQLLQAMASNNNEERKQAEALYEQAKATEPDSVVVGLLAVVATREGIEEAKRRQAAVLLRQLVTRGHERTFLYARISNQHKLEVAAELLRMYEAEKVPGMQRSVGAVITKLAEHVCDPEDPRGWLNPGGPSGWPQLLPLVFRMADPSINTDPASCEVAIRLLKDLSLTMKVEIVAAQANLFPLLQRSLQSNAPKVRCASVLLICELVEALEKKAWAPLLATMPVLVQVLQSMVQLQLESELTECLQSFIDVATEEPDFFKPHLMSAFEPANTFAGIVKAREGWEDGTRGLALQWFVSYVEKRPKLIQKQLPQFAQVAIECCMVMMLEMEDDQQALKEWMARMDDEEGEEGSDELFHAGQEAIDTVAEVLGMDHISTALFNAVGQLVQQEQWQAKHAALAAIKQTVEFVEETAHMDEMAKLLIAHVDHAHPRVRFTALHAIGQLANDQAPQFQERWHKSLMPILMRKMDDPVDRVSAIAMSAFVAFGESLDETLMLSYARDFMQQFVSRLQTSKHRGVREESITGIAVIAGVMKQDFSQYYDVTMPMLKQFVMSATGEKENRLRGKAFECMTLLGVAVGKEKFLPDAKDAITEMMKIPLEADDVQREYIKEASERICHCLGRDFGLFLPVLLPNILRTLALESQGEQVVAGNDTYIQVCMGDGKFVNVKSSRFEEIVSSVQLLHTFCLEMEGAFFDWVPDTAQALLPLLSASDEVSMLCWDARRGAIQVWALLIKCSRAGAKERGSSPDLAQQLLRTFLQQALGWMATEKDPETLGVIASGMAECIKNAGQGCMGAEEVLQLIRRFFELMDQSFARASRFETERQANIAGAPLELQQGEDEEVDAAVEESKCRLAYEETLGAVMSVEPAVFLQCLTDCGQKMAQWLPAKQNKVLVLHFACDMIEHLKEQSVPVWSVFMEPLFNSLVDEDPDARTAAYYAINLAAPLPSFAQVAPEAYRRLSQAISSPPPKSTGREQREKAKVALENAVAALLALAREKPTQCPPDVQAWQIIVAKLPFKDDEEEAQKVHGIIADLVLEQHAGLLGPERSNLGRVLSCLADVYRQENVTSKETDAKILRIFQMIPRELLGAMAGSFSEKQQKRIEKMLTGEMPAKG